jgi:hypothetical protein
LAQSSEIEELLKSKNERLDSVPSRLSEATVRSQKQLFNEVRLLLESFERDGDYILTTPGNIVKLNELKRQLQRLLYSSEYVQAVKAFASEIDKQADINNAVYKTMVDYDESAITAALIDSSKRSAVDALLGGSMDAAFYEPVAQTISSAVSTGAGYVETVTALRLAIEGGEVNGSVIDGRLSRYVGQIASDSFAITDRTYGNQVSVELQLEFYRYTGGLLDSSRPFCKARNGYYFHEKEIETWINGGGDMESNPLPHVEWQGQYRGTNSSSIFNLCGGYNCKHTLMPVDIAAVPVDVIQRNLASGNVTLSAKQKQILGLYA